MLLPRVQTGGMVGVCGGYTEILALACSCLKVSAYKWLWGLARQKYYSASMMADISKRDK